MFTRSPAFSSLFKIPAAAYSASKRTIILLPSLPYPIDQGVRPVFSPKALDYHYNGHLSNYVKRANELVTGTEFHGEELEAIFTKAVTDARHAAIFNNVAQIYNHRFFFNGIIPGGRLPSTELVELVKQHFESMENLQKKFNQYAMSIFGSGWCWLVDRDGDLEIMVTFNAYNPLALPPAARPAPRQGLSTTRITPLLVCDIWEHSYYTDFNMKRQEYLDNWWKAVNWDFVARNLVGLKKASAEGQQETTQAKDK